MEQLKKLRKERGLNQSALAKELDISVSAYGNYELGQREPSIENLTKLADFYGVSIDYLIGHKKVQMSTDWTDEEKALGIGRHATYLSEEETEWLELGSEVQRVKGEEYYKMLKTTIEAVIQQK